MSDETISAAHTNDRARARVNDVVRAFAKGDLVMVTDDHDRENEADLIVNAARVTADQMAFVIRHTCGIVCAPMPGDHARRLQLDPMVAHSNAPLSTAFTVSVDYREGFVTGISGKERARTIRALADPQSVADDFLRPGHVFPLIARDGGVLIRSGHTEAAVDLCRLAGLPPVAAICELVNDDGSVKRGAQITEFAHAHNIPLLSVSDLIAWRQHHENLVERISEQQVTTPAGPAYAYTFAVTHDPMHHLAVVYGDILDGRNIPVRLQSESVLDDVFCVKSGISNAMNAIAERTRGVIVYLREGSIGVARKAPDPRAGNNAPERHDSARQRKDEWREIGIGAQILRNLGVNSITLLASRPRHYVGLGGFGIKIEKTELIDL